MTIRASLEDRERKTGKHSPKLDTVKVPEGFQYLFELYWEIHSGASATGMGGAQIGWRDLADYQTVTGIHLDAFEVDAVLAMDRAMHEVLNEKGAS